MKGKKKIILIAIGILLCAGIVIGSSYAWWTYTAKQESTNVINSTCLKLNLVDASESINLEKAYPLTDDEAKELRPYTFKIENVCDTEAYYDISLEILNTSNLSSEYLAISLDGNNKRMLSSLTSETASSEGKEKRILVSGKELKGNETATHNLKIWIDESVTVNDDAMSKSFASKIIITAGQRKIEKLTENLINRGEMEKFNHEATEQTPALTDYRYVGENPNNYVYFGCDTNCTDDNLYRIIGVIPTQSEVNGAYENRVKLLHYYEYIGEDDTTYPIEYGSTPSNKAYQWNPENNNNWEESSTQENILNNTFYNSLGDYKNYIAPSIWYLGALDYTKWDNHIYTPNMVYQEERGSNHSQNNGALSFKGNIGLMYASDVLFTTGNHYVDTKLNQEDSSNSYVPIKQNWLTVYTNAEWGINSYINSNQSVGLYGALYIHYLSKYGFIHIARTGATFTIRPTFYLKENIKYKSGNGTRENPYLITNL